MHKVRKGERGYIVMQQKKYKVIMSLFYILVSAFFITGLILCKTRNNILTVMAILMVLPAAKFTVDLIMLLPYKPSGNEFYEKLESADDKFLHKYECVFTSKEKAVYALALVITDHAVCIYAPDTKADTKKFEKSLQEYIKADKINVSVSLFTDENLFMKKVKLMSDSHDTDMSEEDKKHMQRIWASASCMCL